jgi:hypothetical protein
VRAASQSEVSVISGTIVTFVNSPFPLRPLRLCGNSFSQFTAHKRTYPNTARLLIAPTRRVEAQRRRKFDEGGWILIAGGATALELNFMLPIPNFNLN